MAEFEFHVEEHIDDVDAEAWDSVLSAEDLLASHRFVRACQGPRRGDVPYRHVLVTQGAKVVATASFSLLHADLDVLAGSTVRRLSSVVRGLYPKFGTVPILLQGLPVSLGSSCLRIAPGVPPAPIVAELADLAERLGQELGAGLIAAKEFSADEDGWAAPLIAHGYARAVSLPSCHLDLRWSGLEPWITSMRSGYRRMIRETQKARADQGLTLRRLTPWTEHVPLVFRMYLDVMARAEHRLELLDRGMFERWSTGLADETVALLVERAGTPLSVAIVAHTGHVSRFLIAGVDHEKSVPSQAYFVLLLAVVEEAFARGARRLELGQTSYDAKLRLGAEVTPRTLYLRHRSPWLHRGLATFAPLLFPERTPAPRRVFRASDAGAGE